MRSSRQPRRLRLLIIAVMAAFLCNACALFVMEALPKKPPELAGVQKEKGYAGVTCRKVLVVGLARDAHRESALETGFIDRFANRGVEVVSSSMVVPDLGALRDEKALHKQMAQQQIDAVITVAVRDVPSTGPFVWHPAAGSPSWAEASRDWKEAREPEKIAESQNNARFEIALWDSASMKRRWVASSKPFNRYDQAEEAYRAADSAVYQLLKGKVLKPVSEAAGK